MFLESLAERFLYEGHIGGVRRFVVLAAYFDESGNYPSNPKRIAVAAAYVTRTTGYSSSATGEQFWRLRHSKLASRASTPRTGVERKKL